MWFLLTILLGHLSFNFRNGQVLGKSDRRSLQVSRNRIQQVNDINLPHRRVINHFITQEENALLLELMQIVEPAMVEQYRGLNYVSGREMLNLEPSKLLNTSISIFDSVHNRLILVKNAVKILRKMHRLMESHFRTAMILESIIVNNRKLPSDLHYYNKTHWSHGVHVDQCNFNYDYNRTCSKNHNINRHYTAILYTSPCLGGDLIFLDHHTRPMKTIPEMEALLGRKIEGEMYCDDPPCIGQATMTIVKPSAGKLAMFTSDTKNVHGVTELKPGSGSRFTMSLWFTRRSEGHILKEAFERGENVDLFLLQQIGYNFPVGNNNNRTNSDNGIGGEDVTVTGKKSMNRHLRQRKKS